jgi:hypothetical protein
LACPAASAPALALEQRLELRGDEAHLRRELHRLLAQVERAVAELGPQEDDRLAEHEPAFVPPNEIARRRRDRLGERAPERGRGVGQPGAVDVQQQAVRVRVVGERLHLGGRVERPRARTTA